MKEEKIITKDNREMILIPAGDFIMGSEEFEPEMPVRTVFLPDYYIDKYPFPTYHNL